MKLVLPLLCACASAFTICDDDTDFRSSHKYTGVCTGVSEESCNVDHSRCELKWDSVNGACVVTGGGGGGAYRVLLPPNSMI